MSMKHLFTCWGGNSSSNGLVPRGWGRDPGPVWEAVDSGGHRSQTLVSSSSVPGGPDAALPGSGWRTRAPVPADLSLHCGEHCRRGSTRPRNPWQSPTVCGPRPSSGSRTWAPVLADLSLLCGEHCRRGSTRPRNPWQSPTVRGPLPSSGSRTWADRPPLRGALPKREHQTPKPLAVADSVRTLFFVFHCCCFVGVPGTRTATASAWV